MNWEALDMENGKTVALKQWLEGDQAEIKHMLVIDRVELALLDEIGGVGEFDDDASSGFEERPQAGDKIVRVGYVGKNVVAEDQVGFATGVCQFLGEVVSEEFHECLDAFLAGDQGDIGGRLDAEAGDGGSLEVL